MTGDVVAAKVKRKGRRESTLEAWRKQLARLGRLVPAPPKDTRVRRVDLDGVKAVAVVTPEARDGRSMLYLHGGGHVTGTPVLYRVPILKWLFQRNTLTDSSRELLIFITPRILRG